MESKRVVVASPGDVRSERNALVPVIAEVNRILELAGWDVNLQLWRWETDVHPGFHADGPQGLIDSILRIEDCDILIGIFWKRFGRPYKGTGSNTEHEIQIAYEAWKMRGSPQILLYFNQKCATPKSSAETDQWGKVLDFKAKIQDQAGYREYKGERDFSDRVRADLLTFTMR